MRTQVIKTAPRLDIHLASNVMHASLEQRVLEMGFKRDEFIGGTTGVVHPCHYSLRPNSRAMLHYSWKEAVSILSTVSEKEVYGYAEAEVTSGKYRTLLPWKPFDGSVAFPFMRLEHQECPSEEYKQCDIHITADLSSIDRNLKRFLEEKVGFQYVDIRKPPGKVSRVYTFQPLGLSNVPYLYKALCAYFHNAGGLEGKVKLETTYAFARVPSNAPVPPVLMKTPHIRDQRVVT